MPHAPEWVSIDQVLSYAASHGVPLSRAQFARWRKRGLLPRPQLLPLRGRGHRGREARYPAIAIVQAMFVALLVDQVFPRNLDLVGWAVWCAGFSGSTAVARRLLVRLATKQLDATSSAYERFLEEDDNNPISGAALGRARPGLGPVRRRVGRRYVETVVRAIEELRLGRFDASIYDEADLKRIIAGLAALTGEPAPKTIAPEAGDQLAQASRDLSMQRVRRALEHASERDLCIVRDEAQTLYRVTLAGTSRHPLAASALVPPAVFLEWFALRYVSRSVRETVRQAAIESGIPIQRPPVLQQILDQEARKLRRRRHS